MQANTWATWLSGSTGEAAGTARQSSSQTRARGWRVRNVACCAALSPDGDPIKADWQANLVALLDDFYQSRVLSNSPGTGLVGTYDDKDTTAGFQHSIFESAIVMSSINWAWDLEPGLSSADKTMHRAVCDHANKAIVGLFGRGPANGEFSWRRATGPYRMVIGSGSSLSTLYDSWLEVHNATYGDSLDSSNGLPILDAYADDPSTYAFGEGVWGYMITALAYAVDHGAAGASAGWARLTSASNWASNTNKFVYRPQHGIMPRS